MVSMLFGAVVRWFVPVGASLLAVSVAFGCSSSSASEEEATDLENGLAEATEVTSPRGPQGTERQPSEASEDEEGDVRAGEAADDGDPRANDRRVREAMERAHEEFERGYYDVAMRYLEEVARLRPLSDEVVEALRTQANMTRTFQHILGSVEPLNHRRDMVRIVFHGGGSTEGIVLERGRRTVLLRRYGGGYERVDTRPSNVYEIEELSRKEQHDVLAERFATLEQRFRLDSRSAVEIARFAREARRYDQAETAHNLLLEAFSLDPWVDESLELEADEDYVAFRHAMQEGERERAADLLRELEQRYPRAELFAEVSAEEPPSEPAPDEPEPESEPQPSEDQRAERIIEESEEQAEQEAEEARRALRVDPHAEIPELEELDARQLLRHADRYRDAAKEHERGASPGADDALHALDEAIYNYRMAQELYRRALDAGADEDVVNPRLTDVNRGLFWARRSRPVD